MTQQTNSYSYKLIQQMDEADFNLFDDFHTHLIKLQETGGIIGVVKKSLYVNPIQTVLELDKFGIKSEDIKKEILNQSFYNSMNAYLTSENFPEFSDFVKESMKKFLSKHTKLDILMSNIDNLDVLFTDDEVIRIIKKNYPRNTDAYNNHKELIDKIVNI